jgi:hypothetical protein
MIQFLPNPIVTESAKKDTIQLGREIKQQQGLQAYVYFKKLVILGMYGGAICGKIDYITYLHYLQQHYNVTHNIFTFWDICNTYNPNGFKTQQRFGVKPYDINTTPLNQMENLMKKTLRNQGIGNIKMNYLNLIKL